jgi:hypothetical protein
MKEEMHHADDHTMNTGWRYAYWILLACWIVGAALTMSRVRAGLLSSYLSDITFPPWFYILLRERVPGKGVTTWIRWIGSTPGRAASAIFLVGLVSEMGQLYGFPTGTYDPWDIAAYAVGLLVCYGIDRSATMKLLPSHRSIEP